MNTLQRIKQTVISVANAIRNPWPVEYSYDTLPPETIRAAASIPQVKHSLQQFSIEEYDRNPHYQLVIENIVSHTLGPHTKVIGISNKVEDRHNDLVEDSYLSWVGENAIGKAYRQIRREAARTGIGFGIPFRDKNSRAEVPTKYKVFNGLSLRSPTDASYKDRIINGIEYDSNWEPKKFYVVDTDYEFYQVSINEVKEYDVSSLIYFCRNEYKGLMWPIPECYAAFTFYPYLRRYLQAVIEKTEFLSSFPMAVELDPKVYSTYTQNVSQLQPTGSFEYEPKMVPTLKPGMKLAGLPHTNAGRDTQETMEMFAAACALTVQMPKNLAVANSDNANMASAQVDIQPWANKVAIDRFDMEPMFRKSFLDWWDIGKYRVMPASVRNAHPNYFPHVYVYQDLFEHPDPNKRASARATDLASGATTLNLLYSQRGMNFRREIVREAKALQIEPEELIRILVSSRSTNALSVLQQNQELANVSETASAGRNKD